VSHPEHRGERVRQAAVRELRAIVERRQIALSALSRASGIPRSTLHNKLRGNGDVSVAQLVQLAIALDVPAADLVALVVEAADGDDTGTQTHR